MKKQSLIKTGFLQSTGIAAYCTLVGYFLAHGDKWFPEMNKDFGPGIVLSVLVTSVLVCALLAFGIPAQLFWDKKSTKEAIAVIAYTAVFLIIYIIIASILFAVR